MACPAFSPWFSAVGMGMAFSVCIYGEIRQYGSNLNCNRFVLRTWTEAGRTRRLIVRQEGDVGKVVDSCVGFNVIYEIQEQYNIQTKQKETGALDKGIKAVKRQSNHPKSQEITIVQL